MDTIIRCHKWLKASGCQLAFGQSEAGIIFIAQATHRIGTFPSMIRLRNSELKQYGCLCTKPVPRLQLAGLASDWPFAKCRRNTIELSVYSVANLWFSREEFLTWEIFEPLDSASWREATTDMISGEPVNHH